MTKENKKLGKITKEHKTKISSPFDITEHKTERTAVAILMHWMREIIEREKLDLGLPEVETKGEDSKYPDLVIYESRRSSRVLCVLEAKPPYFDIFDYEELKKPAHEKAVERKAKYFAVTNFKELIWYNTENVNKMLSEEEQIVEKYHLCEIENLDDIEQVRFKEPIKRKITKFLKDLYEVYTGKKSEPKLPVDEYLVFRLQQKIKILSKYYKELIRDEAHKNENFAKKLANWFYEQGWEFTFHDSDFEKAARQTAYLLINKILFYEVLQAKRPDVLDPLEIPEGLTKGSILQKHLQAFFDEVLKIDYEQIYTTDFIDTLAFPEDREVVKEIKELIKVLKEYDFSKLGYDIIGRIFERLIPYEERHNLGQYFTNPDVVDLILRFCLKHEDDKVLDPACGAGTFLVRAYKHKQMMNQMLKHSNILDTLWGVDIAKFPAHLTTINLAINDLSVDENYPNVINDDFFNLQVGPKGFDPLHWRKRRAQTLGKEEREIFIPRWFDVIVGNPPYTRQEEIPEIGVDKEKLIKNALHLGNKKIANISKRAGIYTYFFIHGTKFLKDKGYFGFIVANSWLDVDYGKGLQEFFLKNYKIIAIVESKVERWFEEADINTCIVILQKCKNKIERDENFVRFVYLKKPLRHFIPPAQDMWEKQLERLNAIDKLIKTILAHNDFYENEDLRIFPKKQKELWEEGFDEEQNKYVGAKWGKYLRAPEIFFKILEKGEKIFKKFKEVCKLKYGIKTGDNKFFFINEKTIKKWDIEKKYIKNAVYLYRNVKTPILNNKYDSKLIYVKEDKGKLRGTKILKYIKFGERKGIDKKETCKRREPWYNVGEAYKSFLIFPQFYNTRFCVVFNDSPMLASNVFWQVLCDKEKSKLLSAYMNSTLFCLFTEIYGRFNLGEGVLTLYGPDVNSLPIISINVLKKKRNKILKIFFEKLGKRSIQSIFKEVGTTEAGEVSFYKVKSDRRELDKIIMGEILGLTEEEQLEVYKAVIDLVRSRIEKAKSVKKKRKTREGIDIDLIVKNIMEKIGENTIGKFYREKILSQKELETVSLPRVKGEIRIEKDLYGVKLYYSPKKHMSLEDEESARYLKIFLEIGLNEVKVPKDKEYLKKVLPELKKIKQKAETIINSTTSFILNPKTKEKVKNKIWMEVMR